MRIHIPLCDKFGLFRKPENALFIPSLIAQTNQCVIIAREVGRELGDVI